MLVHIKAFVAGFVSTLLFHQGLLQLLYVGGAYPRAAWNLAPVPPLGVPAVIGPMAIVISRLHNQFLSSLNPT